MEMTLEPVQLQQKDLLISILVRELFDKYCITDRFVDSYKFPRVLSLDLKEERELQDLSLNGIGFQTEGAAIIKDLHDFRLKLQEEDCASLLCDGWPLFTLN